MIITRQDVSEFSAEYGRYSTSYKPGADPTAIPTDAAEIRFYRWLTDHPQVLMASGFQEYVAAHTFNLYRRLVRRRQLIRARRPVLRTFTGQWILPSTMYNLPSTKWDGFSLRALQALPRNASDEEWEKCVVRLPSVEEMLRAARRLVKAPLIDPTSFVSPKLWTPERQSATKLVLQQSTSALIAAIQAERLDLAQVSAKMFEEIVAEVLRSAGMEIHVVRESPQGGRDILARGELIPGLEPITIAVEVKHRAFVDRPEVQKALHQNRQFPALLFVTSGRFSAGVVREAQLPENRLRLFLQDGVAVREILRTFSFKHMRGAG